MKINFTKKEYKTILEMIYISDWVLNSFPVEEKHENHKSLRKKIFSFYKEMQAEELIEDDEDEFYETAEFEDNIQKKYLEEYNQNVFWESLIDQLSYRDLIKEIGPKAFADLDVVERMQKLEKFREIYTKEFEQHQLDYVKIEHSHIKN